MNEQTKLSDHVLSIDIMAPVEKVWAEITKSGALQPWIYNTVFESTLQPGAKLRYYSPDKKRVFVVGEVKEVVEPTKFVHTYMFTTRPETPSLVTWELAPIDGGTRVTLTHAGWTDQVATHGSVHKGWKDILANLKSWTEKGEIPFGQKMMYGMMGAMAFMMPASSKTEEVAKAGW